MYEVNFEIFIFNVVYLIIDIYVFIDYFSLYVYNLNGFVYGMNIYKY